MIINNEVDKVSHFGVVRDYTIILKSGIEICLDSDIIEMIVNHENEENNER